MAGILMKLPKVKITPSLAVSVKMKIRIVYICDLGKKPITLCLRAAFTVFTYSPRGFSYNIAVKHNGRLVLRDERTEHFLCGTDYSTTNGGLTGFIL